MADTPTTPGAGPHITPDAGEVVTSVFSPAQVVVASLLGTPIAGAILVSLNLASRGRSWPVRALPVVGAVAAIAAALVLDAVVSTAALWILVPACAAAFGVMTEARATPRDFLRHDVTAAAVTIAVVAGLFGAGKGAAVLLGRDLPGLREVLFDIATGDGSGLVRFDDGASRQDARRVRNALQDTGYLERGLRVRVTRPDGELVLSVPMNPPVDAAAVAAAQAMVRAVASQLTPPECVLGRIVAPDGAALAQGRTCPAR